MPERITGCSPNFEPERKKRKRAKNDWKKDAPELEQGGTSVAGYVIIVADHDSSDRRGR